MSAPRMVRRRGLSVRMKLTLSYAGLIMLSGGLLLAVVWVFLLRYVPTDTTFSLPDIPGLRYPRLWIPNQGDLINAFTPRAFQAMVGLLVFSLVGGWILAGRMLAPLKHLTEAIRRAEAGELAHRVRLPGRRDELRDLADHFDSMLERIEAHVQEQRRFAANASHELRTPLAIQRTLLDVAAKDPDRDVDALLARLRHTNDRAVDLTEALLALSRAERGGFATERVDLDLLAEEAAEALLPLAEQHGVTLRVSGEAAPVQGSPALLGQLIANLVHNAIVHNDSPAGFVEVGTQVRDGVVLLTVENSGAVLAPELVATLTEPFQRGSERARSQHAGVGLGLAIALRVTEAHGGTLALAPRPDGGLRAEARFRATP